MYDLLQRLTIAVEMEGKRKREKERGGSTKRKEADPSCLEGRRKEQERRTYEYTRNRASVATPFFAKNDKLCGRLQKADEQNKINWQSVFYW